MHKRKTETPTLADACKLRTPATTTRAHISSPGFASQQKFPRMPPDSAGSYTDPECRARYPPPELLEARRPDKHLPTALQLPQRSILSTPYWHKADVKWSPQYSEPH